MMLLTIDYRNAFSTLSHDFIRAGLTFLSVPPTFVNLVISSLRSQYHFLVASAAIRRPENCFAGGGWHGRLAKEGGGAGVPEMGFRAEAFVLCKDGCCHQRRPNTISGRENFFSLKKFPPHMCSQNDQRDVGIILSHVCWGRTPPPPARQAGQPTPKLVQPQHAATCRSMPQHAAACRSACFLELH